MYEIFNRLQNSPNLFVKILVASLFVNLLALATPIYVIQVLQRYVAYGVTSTLITLVAGIIFVSVFEFFFRNIRHRMARELDVINSIISDKVIKKLNSIKTSYYSFHKNFRPDIITKHVYTTQGTFTATTTLTLIDVPFVLIFLLALFLIHYQLGLLASLLIFVPLMCLSFYRKKIYELNSKFHQMSLNTARLHDNSSSRFETIRYFNLLNALSNAWNKILRGSTLNKEELEAKKNVLSSLMASSSTFMTIVIIGWGAVLAVDGEISVGALIGANILAGRAISPIIRFVQAIEPLEKASMAQKELNMFLQIADENKSGSDIRDFRGKIDIKDLQFIYPNTKNPIFENLSCSISSGSLLVVTGSNGSGKSTLLKSIIAFLDFSRGQIFYDDIEINQISLLWLRQNLIYVPQEPKFVDGSLLDNLIGSREIKKSDMHAILENSDLQKFVNSSPEGITMQLNNRGEDLPFGIRKRIALARALSNDGKLVVMDEPTETLDDKGRSSIYSLIIDFLRKKKTIIISTQDNEIIKTADYIVDLDVKPIPLVTDVKKSRRL